MGIVDDIMGGQHDDILTAIEDGVDLRRKRIAAAITPGTRVRTVNIRPKYLAGQPAKFLGKAGNGKVKIEFEPQVDTGRYGRKCTVHATSIEVV